MVHCVSRGLDRPPVGYGLRTGNAWILAMPQIRQTMPTSCGLAACAKIIGYRTGRVTSDRELMQRHGVNCSAGTTYPEMQRVLRAEIGARFSGVHRATRASLLEALRDGDPVLAGVAVRGGAHAIVVSGIVLLDHNNTRLVINDPGLGMALFTSADVVDAALQAAMVVRL